MEEARTGTGAGKAAERGACPEDLAGAGAGVETVGAKDAKEAEETEEAEEAEASREEAGVVQVQVRLVD